MNVLYFTLDDFESLVNYHSINTDLLREFQKHGHKVYVVSPSEKKKGFPTRIVKENEAVILKPRIGNIQKTNIVEKGISTVTVGSLLIKAIKKSFKDVKFDLILYCTPPITFLSAIEYVKKRDGARTYLLLKDIFPQNAVDLGMMSTTGLKRLLYIHFRNQEKMLYGISDGIGCMSQANVDYIIAHNPEIDPAIVEICPNSIDVIDKSVDKATREQIRVKYDIPLDKTVFVYGGNFGKPQGIPFMIECFKKCKDLDDSFFLIVGDGTEYGRIEDYVKNSRQKNLKLMNRLSKEDYDTMVGACDVGLIFLNHRFSIPNFPSRLLSYMQSKIPVLAVTDTVSDVGTVIFEGGFGWWCESNDSDTFARLVEKIVDDDLVGLGENGFKYLKEHYDVEHVVRKILSHTKKC